MELTWGWTVWPEDCRWLLRKPVSSWVRFGCVATGSPTDPKPDRTRNQPQSINISFNLFTSGRRRHRRRRKWLHQARGTWCRSVRCACHRSRCGWRNDRSHYGFALHGQERCRSDKSNRCRRCGSRRGGGFLGDRCFVALNRWDVRADGQTNGRWRGHRRIVNRRIRCRLTLTGGRRRAQTGCWRLRRQPTQWKI